jgi:hypothetical protein
VTSHPPQMLSHSSATFTAILYLLVEFWIAHLRFQGARNIGVLVSLW